MLYLLACCFRITGYITRLARDFHNIHFWWPRYKVETMSSVMILPALRNVNYSFCLHLDAMFHSAKVVSIGEGKKTDIETVMELSLPRSFVDYLNSTNNIINA